MKENTWAMVAHLSSFLLLIGLPFGHLFGPLAVWIAKKDAFPLVDDQGKESINFQLNVTFWTIVAGVLAWVLIGFVIMAVVAAAWLVLVIVASVRAHRGEKYRYPLIVRPIR